VKHQQHFQLQHLVVLVVVALPDFKIRPLTKQEQTNVMLPLMLALSFTLMDCLVMAAQVHQVNLVEISQIAPPRKLLVQAVAATLVLGQIQVQEQLA
jgi:hypothetical protein